MHTYKQTTELSLTNQSIIIIITWLLQCKWTAHLGISHKQSTSYDFLSCKTFQVGSFLLKCKDILMVHFVDILCFVPQLQSEGDMCSPPPGSIFLLKSGQSRFGTDGNPTVDIHIEKTSFEQNFSQDASEFYFEKSWERHWIFYSQKLEEFFKNSTGLKGFAAPYATKERFMNVIFSYQFLQGLFIFFPLFITSSWRITSRSINLNKSINNIKQ